MSAAPDRFSSQAVRYARSRPVYPDLLLQWVRAQTQRGALCWDVGTGSGQVAALAANHFERVHATDVSEAQLAEAPVIHGVTYATEPAERCTLPDASVDAVVCGAAVHWFDLPQFYAEVRRVCRPGAVLALFSYGVETAGEPALQAVIRRYIQDVLAPWWSDRLAVVEAAYRPLAFPFEELQPPGLSAVTVGDLERFEDLLRTWSAAQLMARATGEDPIDAIRDELHRAWEVNGPAHVERTIRWPIFARVGRVAGS